MDVQETHGLTPPSELQPPGPPPDTEAAPSGQHRWWWALLILLMLLALAVVFALPTLLGPVRTATTQGPAQAPSTITDTGAVREQAQQTLQRYLKLRAGMELDNAGVWGEPDWSGSAGLASAGDRYFAQRQFAAAGREYQAALKQLQQLQANRGVMLAGALDAGARALAADDVVNAIVGFEAALLIEPEHPEALRGIAQARTRGAVLEQMNLGRDAEADGDLETAAVAYKKAVRLDQEYTAAREAFERVSAQINAREFGAAMSLALNALDAGQTAAAGEALADAERIRAGDPAVRDARRRLQGMQAQAGLDRLRRQADDRARVEDWRGAVAAYRRALDIDSSTAYARTGLQRAEQRMKLHQQFDHYLDDPARLYSAAPLANAEQLLAGVRETPRDEPRLADKITRLQRLVAGARTPIRVTLRSDGETSVVVHRVARLGKFDSQQLELRPGDYTLVGSRPGYRDVREVIRVRPGVPIPPLLVRCEEAI